MKPSATKQVNAEQLLGTMRAYSWYREDAEGRPLCVTPGCSKRAAWVITQAGDTQYVLPDSQGALPLNMCVVHRQAQRAHEDREAQIESLAETTRVALLNVLATDQRMTLELARSQWRKVQAENPSIMHPAWEQQMRDACLKRFGQDQTIGR